MTCSGQGPASACPASGTGERVVARVNAFARVLRDNSFTTGVGETRDALHLLTSDLGARPDLLRQGFKTLFCGRQGEWSKFDQLFDTYWLGRGTRTAVRVSSSGDSGGTTDRSGRNAADATASRPGDQLPASQGDDPVELEQTALGMKEGASRVANLATTDLRRVHNAESLALAHAQAERLARRMRLRLMRRYQASARGRRVDLRRTIRHAVSSGGAPVEIVRVARRRRQLQIVALLDVSGSMSEYTSIYIRFVHGLLAHFSRAEAFFVHTQLVHVSQALGERNSVRALDRLSLLAQGVGGGTRIGHGLETLNKTYARRIANSRTCVLIFSDGYDTSPATLVGQEMRKLARRCRCIIWLNPMMGWPGYEPVALGMQAAMPHIDLLISAHTLESLAAIEPHLARI